VLTWTDSTGWIGEGQHEIRLQKTLYSNSAPYPGAYLCEMRCNWYIVVRYIQWIDKQGVLTITLIELWDVLSHPYLCFVASALLAGVSILLRSSNSLGWVKMRGGVSAGAVTEAGPRFWTKVGIELPLSVGGIISFSSERTARYVSRASRTYWH
jgi:hypothetical protein